MPTEEHSLNETEDTVRERRKEENVIEVPVDRWWFSFFRRFMNFSCKKRHFI